MILNIDNGLFGIDLENGRVGLNTQSLVVSLTIGANDGILIPVGNNEQRPNGFPGIIRYNSENNLYEGYFLSTWEPFIFGAGTLPGGSNTEIQFHDEGDVFGGVPSFTFNKATNTLFVSNSISLGANVNLGPSSLFIGNSTANVVVNSSFISLSNSTYIANLDSSKLIIGLSTINSTALSVGANILFDSTHIFIGNSTVNLNSNSILISLANSTGIANLQPTQLVIGTSQMTATQISEGANVIINTTAYFVGNTTQNSVVNSTGFFLNGASFAIVPGGSNTTIQISDSGVFNGFTALTFNKDTNNVFMGNSLLVGANIVLDRTHLFIGNTTANLNSNSILISLVNSTSIANLDPLKLVIGTTTVNSTVISVGANVSISTVRVLIGNTTANLNANSILISITDATGIANLQSTQLVIGGSLVNSTAYKAGSNVFLDTTKLSVGNSIANLVANSILVSLANSTGIANLQPTQLVIGTSTVNTTVHAEGANVIANTTAYFVGNSTQNTVINSTGFFLNGIASTITGVSGAGGSNTYVQINDSGSLGGFAGFIFDKTTNNVTVANTLTLTKLISGNSTANLNANSILISLANSTGVSNLTPTSLQLAANVLLDTTKLSVGNSTANLLANSILVSVANSTNIANLDPTQLVIGSSTLNSTAISVGTNIVANTTVLNIGTAAAIRANGTIGTSGQALLSNGTTNYYGSPQDSTIFPVGSLLTALTNGAASFYYSLGYGLGATTGTEAIAQMPIIVPGTFNKFLVRNISAQPASGSLSLWIRINGVDSSTITIPAGQAANSFFINTTPVVVSANDLICIKGTNNANTTQSAATWGGMVQFIPS